MLGVGYPQRYLESLKPFFLGSARGCGCIHICIYIYTYLCIYVCIDRYRILGVLEAEPTKRQIWDS